MKIRLKNIIDQYENINAKFVINDKLILTKDEIDKDKKIQKILVKNLEITNNNIYINRV